MERLSNVENTTDDSTDLGDLIRDEVGTRQTEVAPNAKAMNRSDYVLIVARCALKVRLCAYRPLKTKKNLE